MKRSKKVTLQLLICFGLCIVTTLSFAQPQKGVIIVNPESTPVWIADVENPAHSPLRVSQLVLVEEGRFSVGNVPLGPTLPGDRRFVIEYVSFICSTDSSVEPIRAQLGVSEKTGPGSYSFHHYPILLTKTMPDSSGYTAFIGTQSQRWYHDGGQDALLGVTLNGVAPTGGILCFVEASGYTVGMP